MSGLRRERQWPLALPANGTGAGPAQLFSRPTCEPEEEEEGNANLFRARSLELVIQ